MIRHFARQLAVQSLYQAEVGNLSEPEVIANIEEMVSGMKEEAYGLVEDNISISDLNHLEKQFQLDDFYYNLVSGTFKHLDALDAFIEENISGWSLKRLNKVDKAILRLAAYELKFETEMAPEIVINEALELTKEFSNADGKATAFNNKVLDQMKQSLQREA